MSNRVDCPNPECDWVSVGAISGDITCPSCQMVFRIMKSGLVSMVRSLVLRGARTYTFGGVARENGKPFSCNNDNEYAHLVASGHFEELPPIGYRYLEYRGNNSFGADVRGDGKLSVWNTGDSRLVSRFELDKLKRLGKFREIDNSEILERYDEDSEFKYLIIRDMGMGDILMVSDAIRAFKKQYPKCEVTLAVNGIYQCILHGNPWIDQVIAMSGLGFDPGFDLVSNLCRYSETTSLRTSVHRADIFAKGIGIAIPEDDHEIKIYLSDSEIKKAKKRLSDRSSRKVWVGIQTHGSTVVRTWPAEYCKSLIGACVRLGFGVAVFGDHKFDASGENVVNFTGNRASGIDCRELSAIIANLDVTVTPDSGLYHVAEAVGVHSIPIFSTILPDLRIRYYDKCHWIYHDESCGPCWDAGCDNSLACLYSVKPDTVMKKVREVLMMNGAISPNPKRKRKVVEKVG